MWGGIKCTVIQCSTKFKWNKTKNNFYNVCVIFLNDQRSCSFNVTQDCKNVIKYTFAYFPRLKLTKSLNKVLFFTVSIARPKNLKPSIQTCRSTFARAEPCRCYNNMSLRSKQNMFNLICAARTPLSLHMGDFNLGLVFDFDSSSFIKQKIIFFFFSGITLSY